jgi:hypothetical protein
MCPPSRTAMCYKISILPRNPKEMPMRKKCSRRATLWDLFRPAPERPTWSNLPPETRQKATRLLAGLLREHQDQGANDAHEKEVDDE